MATSVINTAEAPEPIGPYNQAVRAGDLVFISGQIPADPATGRIVTGDISTETHQVMRNLKAILRAAGLDFPQVVKSTIFVTDLANFGIVNEIYGQYFSQGQFPARETVQVAALPKGVQVEISMIAAG
jgi:2-iminobutanoate/2-iminopropanoate deaminase